MIDTITAILLSLQGAVYAGAALYLITEIDPLVYDRKENVRFTLGSLVCAGLSALFFYSVFK